MCNDKHSSSTTNNWGLKVFFVEKYVNSEHNLDNFVSIFPWKKSVILWEWFKASSWRPELSNCRDQNSRQFPQEGICRHLLDGYWNIHPQYRISTLVSKTFLNLNRIQSQFPIFLCRSHSFLWFVSGINRFKADFLAVYTSWNSSDYQFMLNFLRKKTIFNLHFQKCFC